MWRGHSAMSSTHERRVVQSPVDVFLVFVDPRAPRKVRLHASPLHGLEDIRLAVESVQGLVAHLLVFVNVQGQDAETRGLLLGLNDDGVLQAATQCDDGDAAIPLGAHLRQAARLVPRRHEEEVAAGHHLVLHFWIEAHKAADSPRVGGLTPTQRIGVLPLAVSHHDQLRAARNAVAGVLHQPVNDLHHDVHTFLPSQAADEANQYDVGLLPQSQLLLKLGLVGTLALDKILHRKIDVDVLVRLWVPAVVDAVQDADQSQGVALSGDEWVEPKAATERADLLRIGGRHGDYPVGVQERGLGQVHAVAELEVFRHPLVDTEEVASGHVRVLPLVAQVMDHVDGPRLLIAPVPAVLVAEIERHQPSLPIVRQEEHPVAVGPEAVQVQDQRGLHRCHGQ
mmetsp:Transcript_59540/g.172435  ORF Transcript_59540/g.172435 Transcript_59540/m.172435 type:complete len:396 (+) Transcript_59540:64-1251(+)